MKNKNYFPLVLLLLILASACNKKEDDTITQQTISGMVYNQCTDSGLANVQVYFKINKDNSPFQSIETVSGTNGTFSFANADIHSNSKYTYALYIPSKSGIGGGEVAFEGTSLFFNNNEASNYFKPRVIPCFYQFNISFMNTVTTSSSDSLIVQFKQNIFHANVPSLPYVISAKFYGNLPSSFSSYQNYSMGLREIVIDKWKSGVHTTTQDSIYLGWGATKTYIVNW